MQYEKSTNIFAIFKFYELLLYQCQLQELATIQNRYKNGNHVFSNGILPK